MTTSPSSSRPHPRRTDDASFAADVAASPLVLVKFSGAWCPPCRALQPTLDAIARDRSDLSVFDVDVDASHGLAEQFGVRSIPTLVAFRDGKPIGQLVGNQPRARIEALLRT
ncbi:thioredoxin family protein [Nannocystis sp. ILAH1]|uniref:thioredoxin family protein n=1 Tax=unclassified Nannocystis TaxID=2627009 RepID=UPI002271D448|nr:MULTISPECIES: thioredoxin family protein [unclassified Nannocystis]MCY0992533.1 thioredoxin family protein [Nannocystis sp. ILAH1]MCY1070241.1 thioredoxin family protein [Nannocystis sp. RBIL2]